MTKLAGAQYSQPFYLKSLSRLGIIIWPLPQSIVGFSSNSRLGMLGFMAIGAHAVAGQASKSPNYGTFFIAMLAMPD